MTGDAIVCRKCGGRVFIGRNRCVRCGEELVLVAGVGAGADLESIEAHIARDDDAKEAGRVAEAAAVVAYLRRIAEDDRDGPAWLWAAAQIEAGEHRG